MAWHHRWGLGLAEGRAPPPIRKLDTANAPSVSFRTPAPKSIVYVSFKEIWLDPARGVSDELQQATQVKGHLSITEVEKTPKTVAGAENRTCSIALVPLAKVAVQPRFSRCQPRPLAYLSQAKMCFPSFFMLITVQPFALASSYKVWGKVPTLVSGKPWGSHRRIHGWRRRATSLEQLHRRERLSRPRPEAIERERSSVSRACTSTRT